MKARIILVLLTGLFLMGCKSKEEDTLAGIENLYFTSPLELSGRFDGNLTVTLKELKDTRCPRNVICIQQGHVDLTLLVRNAGDSARVKAVYFGKAKEEQPVKFRLGDRLYTMIIQSVMPHPLEGQHLKIEDYVVGLRILER